MRSLRSASSALSAPRVAATVRPQCHLPCWPACRAASSSAVTLSAAAYDADNDTPTTLSRPRGRSTATHDFAPASTSTAHGTHLSDSTSEAIAQHAHRRRQDGRFVQLATLLKESKKPGGKRLTLARALRAVSPDAYDSAEGWPISQLLKLPATPQALGLLLPVILTLRDTPLTASNVRQSLLAFGRFAVAATSVHAHTLIAPVVDAALSVIDAELHADLAAGVEVQDMAVRVIARHILLLKALVGYSETDNVAIGQRHASVYPAAVQHELGKVLQQLLKRLASLSDASASQQLSLALSPSTIEELFSPQLLVPATVAQLLDHCRRSGIHLAEPQWRHAAAALVSAGNTERALHCLAHAAKGRDALNTSHRIMAAQAAGSFEDALHILRPIIAKVEPRGGSSAHSRAMATLDDDTLLRAYSVLASHAAKDTTLPAEALLALAQAIPTNLQGNLVITPVLHGLVERGDLEEAQTLWKEMLARHTAAPPEERPALLDAAALSVGAELLFVQAQRTASRKEQARARGAIIPPYDTLLRPFRLIDAHGALGRHRQPRTTVMRSVPLDSRVLAVLLHMCARAGAPGPAFRLWKAAHPRWGIWPDDASLALLLDTARLCIDRGFDHELDTFRGRLRALAGAIKPPAPPAPEVNVDWARCSVEGLLDPPRYSWHSEHGVQPWQLARNLFRSIVLENWPALAEVPSPLEHGTGPISVVADFITPRGVPPAPAVPLPAAGSQYTHIVPGPVGWASFVFLLERHAAEWTPQEIPQALAWMRALGVRPTWRTMATALMHIGEVEGPRRRVRINGRTQLARDEEILRAWLGEWVPTVPTEEEVARFHRDKVVERARERDSRGE